jgi:hypothetical protein
LHSPLDDIESEHKRLTSQLTSRLPLPTSSDVLPSILLSSSTLPLSSLTSGSAADYAAPLGPSASLSSLSRPSTANAATTLTGHNDTNGANSGDGNGSNKIATSTTLLSSLEESKRRLRLIESRARAGLQESQRRLVMLEKEYGGPHNNSNTSDTIAPS